MRRAPGESVHTNNQQRTADLLAIGGGMAVLATGCVMVRNSTVTGVERSVFHAINDLPQALYYPIGLPLQFLGVLVVGPLVAVAALILRRRRLALAVLLATVLKLVTERLVKAVVSRERPGTSIGSDVHLRGDVSASGESFVSGHAILAAAIAGVVMPYLPGRWKALPWVLVLGAMVGRVYVGAHNPLDVVCGAGLGIAIAGVVNVVVAPRSFRRGTAAAVAAMAVTASGCASTANGAGTPADEIITVGSFDFTESIVLAEVYSQGLEAAGYEVERAFAIGPREFAAPALSAGLIELLPEYAGTAAEFHSDGAAEPTDDVTTARRELVTALDGEPLVVLASSPGQDANTFVVTAETAQRLDLDALTDLGAIAGTLVFGGPPECAQRLLCLPGLADVYGITFGDFVPLDAGGPLTTGALLGGQIDVGLMFSTDPAIDELGLIELEDDAGLQPAENVTPLVHRSVVEQWGDDVVAVIDATSARLTTAQIRSLNGAANQAGADVAAVASLWWSEVDS